MTTITIKASDEFAQNLLDMANQMHVSKSELIRQAVERFCQQQSEKERRKRIQSVSRKVAQSSEVGEWDFALNDGLETR